jgi:hypothetical protein
MGFSHRGTSALLATVALLAAAPAHAQSVVVDDGTFSLTLQGRPAGTESFTIRRAGLGDDATIIAHGVVQLDLAEGRRELRPMLQAIPPEGVATGYQLKISGLESTQVNMTLAGRRYVSVLRSERGEEEREFLAREGTRVLEPWVAHHYWFLRDVREGERVWIIEPRDRRQRELRVTGVLDDAVTVAGSRVPARRVTLEVDGEARRAWFDAQGHVLRLEIPERDYAAQRQDLPG